MHLLDVNNIINFNSHMKNYKINFASVSIYEQDTHKCTNKKEKEKNVLILDI